MRVSEICSRHVVVTHKDEPVVEAARRMRSEHVGDLVVVDDRDGREVPVGVLTDRDIVVGVVATDLEHIGQLDVGDVMTSELVTATEDEDVAQVLRRMRSFGVRRVPVLDGDGALGGILSIDDVLSGLADELSEIAAVAWKQRAHEPARRP